MYSFYACYIGHSRAFCNPKFALVVEAPRYQSTITGAGENKMTNETMGAAVLFYPLPTVRVKKPRPSSFLANVDAILDVLWPDEGFRKYLNAVTNKSAVEGKFECDRTLAAKMIRDQAAKSKFLDVAAATCSRIMRAIETLLRRDDYGKKLRLAALNSATPA